MIFSLFIFLFVTTENLLNSSLRPFVFHNLFASLLNDVVTLVQILSFIQVLKQYICVCEGVCECVRLYVFVYVCVKHSNKFMPINFYSRIKRFVNEYIICQNFFCDLILIVILIPT